MTTVDAAAAIGVRKRVTFAAFACLLSIGLGGCETASNLFASNETAAPVADPAVAQATAQAAKVAVAAVIGPSETVARSLEAQMQAALVRQNITVARTPTDKAEYTLRGYLVSAREKAGTKISHVWDVTDPTGKRVNRITGEELAAGAPGKDPWSAVTPQLVDQIANKTATSFATWLPTQGSAVAPPAPPQAVPVAQNAVMPATPAVVAASPAVAPAAMPKPQTAALTPSAAGGPAPATTASIERPVSINAMVPTVSGAPGDGSLALTNAIQRELSKSGIALTDKASTQTYSVEGKVAVGEGKDGKQPISIDWHVKDPAGKKLGTVSQKNEVAQGSLDGAWGKTADAAAAKAAEGIVRLLPAQTKAN